MLQPLRVAAPPAPPTLSAPNAETSAMQRVTAASTVALSLPQTPLAKVCAIEHLTVPDKSKSDRGASVYSIELYCCPPGRVNAMLTPTWRIGADLGPREPDSRLTKTYADVYKFYDALKAIATKCAQGKPRCRLCYTLVAFYEDQDTTPHALNRMFIGSTRKCRMMQDVLAKFIYLIVRAQRPPRPTVPFVPNCDNQDAIVACVAAFLEL